MQPYAEKNAATHELEGFEAVVGMAEQLPFEESSFDRAVCTLVNRGHSCSSTMQMKSLNTCSLASSAPFQCYCAEMLLMRSCNC